MARHSSGAVLRQIHTLFTAGSCSGARIVSFWNGSSRNAMRLRSWPSQQAHEIDAVTGNLYDIQNVLMVIRSSSSAPSSKP